MKARELMINDLIYVYGQNGDILAEPHWYVRQVTADWLVAMARSEANDKKLKDYGVVIPEQQSFIGDTKPIPLTEEMLLLNGFRKRSHYYELYVEDGDYYFEICNFDDSLSLMFANTGIILNYVHQLQHALRLAGLNELADNFKVE